MPTITNIPPIQNTLVPGPTTYLGYNTSVSNHLDTGINTNLPLNVNNVLTVKGGLNINSISGNSNLTIDAEGNISTQGYLSLGGGLFTLGGNSLSIGDNFHINSYTGAAITTFPYNNYLPPPVSTNTTTTIANNGTIDFTSTTSQYLATQTYVDQQLWKQTVRINTILGTDSSVLDSFNNVYKLVSALEGSTTANALGGLVDQTNEINTTVSDLAGEAIDPVLINCHPVVWNQQCAPLPIPSNISNSIDGWYFRNLLTTNNITWYLPTNGVMKLGEFSNLYANVFAVTASSLPTITIYTQPKGDNTDIIPETSNAKITYSFVAITDNQYYCLYTGTKVPNNIFNATPIQCV